MLLGERVLLVLETGVGQRYYQQATVGGATGRNRFALSEPLRVDNKAFSEIRWSKGKWRPTGIEAKKMRYRALYFGQAAMEKKNRIDEEDDHPW